jgi:hypothetical protein
MHIINTVNSKRFSLNGIEYLKNYVTEVSGSNIRIFNCYDNCDELLPPTRYNNFLVNGISFSTVNQLQAALLDVLYVRTTLGEVAPDIDQDNISIVRYINMGAFNMATLLNTINTGPAFTISEKQSLWYVVHASGTILTPGSIYKYKVTKVGKGTYGANGTQLTASNLELVYVSTLSVAGIKTAPSTMLVNFGALPANQGVVSYMNARPEPIDIQGIEDGYTIFEGTIDGVNRAYLWTGLTGRYGATAKPVTADDFEAVSKMEDGPETPGYNAVLGIGNETTVYAVHKDDQSESLTAYGLAIKHVGNIGKEAVVVFNEPVEDVQYSIPAKITDDTFAMVSDFHKPVKVVNESSAGYSSGTYSLSLNDRNLWLSFNLEEDFTVVIPLVIFPENSLIEGDTAGNGQATFSAETGVLLHHGITENPRTEGVNSVFGLKFRSATDVLLFGKLDLI